MTRQTDTCVVCVGHDNQYDLACIECVNHTLKPCGNPAVCSYEPDTAGRIYVCAEHFANPVDITGQPFSYPSVGTFTQARWENGFVEEGKS